MTKQFEGIIVVVGTENVINNVLYKIDGWPLMCEICGLFREQRSSSDWRKRIPGARYVANVVISSMECSNSSPNSGPVHAFYFRHVKGCLAELTRGCIYVSMIVRHSHDKDTCRRISTVYTNIIINTSLL